MECPDCGETVRAKQKFCHECGAQLQKRQKFQDCGDGGGVVVPTSSTASAVLAGKSAGEPDSSREGPIDLTVGEGSVSSLSTDHNANMEMPSSHISSKPMEAEPMETDAVEDEKSSPTDGGSSGALKDGKPPEGSTSNLGGERPLPDDKPPVSLPDDKRPVSPTVLADTLQKSIQLESPVQESKGLQGLERGDVGSLGEKGSERSRPTEMGQGDNQRGDLEVSCLPEPPGDAAKDEQVTKAAASKADKDKGLQKDSGKVSKESVQQDPAEEKEPQSQAHVASEAQEEAKSAAKTQTKAFVQEIIHHPPKDEHSLHADANKNTAHGEDQDKEKEKSPVQETGQPGEDNQGMASADTSMEDSVIFVGEGRDERNSQDGPSTSVDQDDDDGWETVTTRKEKKKKHKNRKRQDPADKAKKEQENQSHYRPPPNKTLHKPDEGGSTMTLHFHVLVSPDFKMKPKVDQVHVRSDIVDWNDWESLAVLEITRHLKDDYLVAEGKCTVNLARVSNKYISFKYVVIHQDNKMSWEFIHYDMGGVLVNRCFKLSAEECQPGAEVHLYNDVMQVERGLADKFKSFFGWSSVEKKIIHDRRIAAQAWLPRWKGFTCDHQGEEQLACDVMKQVEAICHWLTLSPISAGTDRRTWALKDFSIAEVLLEYIRPKLDQMEKTKEHKSETPEEAQARIVSALSLCWLVHRFSLHLTEKQVHALFDGLLIRPDVKDKSCHEVEAFSLHFCLDGRLKEVTDAVISLINTAMSGNASGSRSLLALPVLHFLKNESTPFKPVAPTTDFQKASQKWWGLEGLKYKQFKKDIKYGSAEKPLAVMKELDPALFEADRLLERSCAAILTNKELLDPVTVKTVSLPTLCAAIAVNVATGYSLSLEEDRQAVLALLETATALAASNVTDTADKGDDAARKEACQTFCIANEVLLSCLDACTYLERHPILIGAVHLAAACMSNLWILMGSATEAKARNMQTSMMKLIENVTTPLVMKWLDKKLNARISLYAAGEESKVWLGILSVDWGKEEVNNHWNKRLLGNLHQRLHAISPMERVELFCSLDTSTFPQHLAQCYSDAAFEAVDNIVKSKNGQQIVASYARSPDESKYKYGGLFSRMLCRTWPATNDGRTPPTDLKLLQHMLTWQPCAGILKLFGEASDLVTFLNEDSQTHIASYKSLLGTAVQELTKGSILISHLHLLLQHRKQFLELCNAVAVRSTKEEQEEKAKKAKGSGKHDANMVVKVGDTAWPVKQLEKVLDWRGKEMEAIKTETRQIDCFLSMCEDIKPVACEELEQKVRRDKSAMSLNELCQPVAGNDITKVSFDMNQPPNVTYFGITPEFREMSTLLENLSKSIVFNKIWEKVRPTQPGEEEETLPALTVDGVLGQVWTPAYQKWLELRQNVKDGKITLQDVDETFGQFKNEYRKLENELKMLAKNRREGWVKERVLQIEQYHQLNKHLDAADVVKDVKEKYNLKGDFKGVEILLHSKAKNFKQNPLSSINKKVVNAGKLLKEMTEERIESLRKFVKCQRLVDWLRTKIHDTKELKVFVDLASISAGESDIEVDKVNCLLSAGVGYAPLIYDLDEDSDFDTLMKCCRQFWAALEKDKHLPKKLMDTCRNLEWLKGVSDSHGSVEMSSLSQTEAINARGVYEIGCFGQNQSLNDLESVVRLQVEGAVSEEDDDEDMAVKELKEYNLSMLKSLQSKLMLLAGKADKGSQEVDRFVEILTGVTRLGQAYVHLYNAGAVLFNNWNAVVYCDGNRRVKVMVNFGFGTEALYGTRAAVDDQLTQLAKYMEVCLEEWLGAMDKARLEYDELNHFTTEQIVVLRKALAKMIDPSETVTPQVLALLSSIKPLCAEDDIRKAMSHVAGDIDAMEEENIKEEPMVEETEKKTWSMDDEEREEFVQKLKQMVPDLTDRVATAAMKATKGNVEEALGWCISNMDDDDMIEEILNSDERDEEEMPAAVEDVVPEMVEDSSIIMLTSIQEPVSLAGFTSMSLAREEPRKETMIKRMESVWGEYLTTVKSTTFEEYISIDHLALVLRNLSSTANIAVGRQWPSRFLEAGKPNLVVCPQDDIWQTVLSLYMQGQTTQPLPSYREVLICTPHTSLEEVVLLWRRAVGDQTGGIFCLVAADQLDYDVSVRAEEMRCKLFQGKSGYHVVVVCASERQHQSYMVTALDQYKVSIPHVPSQEHVQEYLLSQFQQQDAGSTVLASAVDHQRSSVRVVSSQRAGVGKSLVVQRLSEELTKKLPRRLRGKLSYIKVPLHEATVNNDAVLEALLPHSVNPASPSPRIIHLDISPLVHNGVDCLLFNLLVLGSLVGRDGSVWRRLPSDLYVVEHTYKPQAADTQKNREEHKSFVSMLPSVTCISPRQTYNLLTKNQQAIPGLRQVDEVMFRSVEYQRPYQYLRRWMAANVNLDTFVFTPTSTEGTHQDFLHTVLSYCGMEDPSWAELLHFLSFLNYQLQDYEHSAFCLDFLRDTLPGFRKFVVQFMIIMSKDFATPSLNMSDQSPSLKAAPSDVQEQAEIQQFQLRRTWENSPHPYLFFNADHNSMTFLGFYVDRAGSVIDASGQLLEQNVISGNLYQGLTGNGVKFNVTFDDLTRFEKIQKLCFVMGIHDVFYDPDPSYELTTDNVKKILAIQMRFRCNIPVIIMGETGCGKTRLIRFMCDLQAGHVKGKKHPENMIIMKVHGGVRAEDIIRKVERAQQTARINRDRHNIDTVLFFDEANTTEAIGLIKEIMCDGTIAGQPLNRQDGCLKIVAAINPYRRHTDDMIRRLEEAGLGYHIKATETKDRFGHIPLRQLVYRVQPLPPSMLPLVWDFGQLSSDVEEKYIVQMVNRCIKDNNLPATGNTPKVVSAVLAASQRYMRSKKDECSFVSLRDAERTLTVLCWFYQMSGKLRELMPDTGRSTRSNAQISDFTRALVLAIGVCYHSRLETRKQYRRYVAQHFTDTCLLPQGPQTMEQEIDRCQEAFLDELKDQLGANIACNTALKENVFMMVVCIELQIPLFLVGKPGSSKSLAKTIVADAMQGDSAPSSLFKGLKQAQMVSFQCSPLATPEGIVGTFRQCSKFQKDKDLSRFVSVVVLDEVGLAEDSPKMPLKTLHPLLEDGYEEEDQDVEEEEEDDDESEEEEDEEEDEEAPDQTRSHKKVAFVGISNWALDPAKMNRGIFVSRGKPRKEDLTKSARGICENDHHVLASMKTLLPHLCDAYLKLYNSQDREFFGLRDFYSLVKMVYGFCKTSERPPTKAQVVHAVLRNYGGRDDMDPLQKFEQVLMTLPDYKHAEDPDCTPSGLIRASVQGMHCEGESRYLMVLTQNYAALGILQQELLSMTDTVIIFGSSFPKDLEYTQVCRNINRIKVCMETGRTVVLLNLENLYESLYDALNQYYVYFGGQRYVDLGLGTHRVKCRVHQNFRLVVVAEKDIVYERFPIPLVNRLEKHFLAISTVLSPQQKAIAHRLEQWAEAFATQRTAPHETVKHRYTVGDAFVGYHPDTAATLVFQVCSEMSGVDTDDPSLEEEILQKAQDLLLQCATPDAVVRLSKSRLSSEEAALKDKYFHQQHHSCLQEFLCHRIHQARQAGGWQQGIQTQVTTHSKLLSHTDARSLATALDLPPAYVAVMSLQQFDTEHQFCKQIRDFLTLTLHAESVLVVQCDSGHTNSNLIACARYCVQDEQTQVGNTTAHLVFIVQLPRLPGGCFVGFQGGRWTCAHIDDLQPPQRNAPDVGEMINKPISQLLGGHRREEDTRSMDMDAEEGEEEENTVDRSVQMEEEDPVHGTEAGVEEDMDVEEDEEPREVAMERDGGDTLEEMDLDDIELELNAEREEVDPQPKTADKYKEVSVLDDKMLLVSCIQATAAMLEDPKHLPKRRTVTRIEKLMELLQERVEKGPSFCDVVKARIVQLLEEKERNKADGGVNWLTNEAATPKAITEAGTLRQSAWNHLSSVIAPLLAEIVAYADRNCNLDHMVTPAGEWTVPIFLEILSDQNLVPFHYSDMLSPVMNVQRQKIPVLSSGCGEQLFECRLPFSWVIRGQVDAMLKTAQKMEASTGESPDQALPRLFRESTLGKIIHRAAEQDQSEEDIAARYLHDYVWMTYRMVTTSVEEIEMVCSAVELSARELHAQSGSEELFCLTIPAVHTAFSRVQGRLHNLAQLLETTPGLLQKLCQVDFQSDTSMTVDTTAVLVVLEGLTPEAHNMATPEERQSWLGRMQCVAPVVERVFAAAASPDNSVCYGEKSLTQVHMARFLWIRLQTLQMFMEHMFTSADSEESLSTKQMDVLWKVLSNEPQTDFKSVKTMKKVERFLKSCNSQAGIKHFSGGYRECMVCQEGLREPVKLPCDHVGCQQCLRRWLTPDRQSCPLCRAAVPEDFQCTVTLECRDAVEKHNAYRRCCNSFFMELVSRFCFAGGTPPEAGVVEMLLNYVVRKSQEGTAAKTKKFTPFEDDCIDQTPVIRSFLLQLLLRANSQEVIDHMEKYLHAARGFVEDKQEVIELLVIFIQCMEDSYKQEAAQSHDTETAMLEVAVSKLQQAGRQAQHNRPGLSVATLLFIANIRFGLSVAAQLLHEYHGRRALSVQEEKRLVKRTHYRLTKRLLDQAWRLCEQLEWRWPQVFLLKQLYRSCGMDSLLSVTEQAQLHQHLQWIIPPEARGGKEEIIPDRFIVCGDDYRRLREELAKSMVSKNMDAVNDVLQAMNIPENMREVELLLALYREVTVSRANTNQARHPSQDYITVSHQYLHDSPVLTNKQLAMELLTNNQGGGNLALSVTPNQPPIQRTLSALVIHTAAVLGTGVGGVLLPLQTLLQNPQNHAGSYFPTMPEDMLVEARQALAEGEIARFGQDARALTWFQCANGHPYPIGECGQPMEESRCPDCGAPIGGANHRPVQGVQVARNNDATRPGHILGPAANRPAVPIAERALSVVATCVVRLVMHAAMVKAATNNQGVANVIDPRPPNPSLFLWQHLELDLQQLGRALGRSADDAALFMHLILHNLLAPGAQVAAGDWSSKASRRQWEEAFMVRCVNPILHRGLDAMLQQANAALHTDDRLSNNPLLQLLCEVVTPRERLDLDRLVDLPEMWRHRPQINLESLTQTMAENQLQLPVLEKFLAEKEVLEAMRHLPDILRLQKLLITQYQGHIDVAEAMSITVSDFLNKLPEGAVYEEFRQLVESFRITWNLIRHLLARTTSQAVPRELCQTTFDPIRTSLYHLLPIKRTVVPTSCSTALVLFLASAHNSFVQETQGHAAAQSSSTSRSVLLSDVNTAHVVCCHPDQDLLPLVLSHCCYSLAVGEGSRVEYDLPALERQLVERFVSGKPRINDEFETFVFRQETKNVAMYKSLRDKIPQEPLSKAVQMHILQELGTLTNVCSSLAAVDIALIFLATTGGDPNTPIREYLHRVLKMTATAGLHSMKANQHCRLKHILSLWQLLAVQRARMSLENGQDPFEDMPQQYGEKLDKSEARTLKEALRHINVDSLLAELYELIAVAEEQTRLPDWSMMATLSAYIDDKNAPEVEGLDEHFPPTILLKHAYHTWRIVATYRPHEDQETSRRDANRLRH